MKDVLHSLLEKYTQVRSMKIFTKKELKIFLTFFLISSIFIHWGGWYENSVLFLTKSIVDEQRFEIDSFANLTSDRSYFNGKYYSDKAPLTSVIGIPSYIFAKTFFTDKINTTTYKFFDNNRTAIYVYKNPGFSYFTTMIIYTIGTSVIFSSLSLIIFYRILRHFFNNEIHTLLLTFILGFATLLFPYALNVNVQPIAVFFLLLSFYFILRQEKNKRSIELVFAGISLGMSFTADYSIAVAALLLIAYVFFARKNLVKTSIFLFSSILILIPLLSYNYLLLGNPFTFMQKYEDPNVFSMVPKEVFDSYGFLVPNIGAMYQVIFGFYRGLFFYYPILILSIVGLFYMRKPFKKEAILFSLILIAYIIFNSARTTWHGGYTFGPRYLYYTVPFLVIALGFTFKDFKTIPFKLVFFAFLFLSLFSNILSLQLFEDELIDSKTLLIQDKYQEVTNSFGILPSSLYGHYFPLFLLYGPRSLIIENLAEGHLDIDIRDVPFSRDWKFPYHSNVNTGWIYPFILLIPLLIWFKEIKSFKHE